MKDIQHASGVRSSQLRQAGAALKTLYASGMRMTEAVTLPCKALRKDAPDAQVRGKGDKERLVPMQDRAVEAIHRWRNCAKAYGVTSEKWILYSVRDGSKALTRQSALAEIKQAALDARLRRSELISPLKLRRAFVSHLSRPGSGGGEEMVPRPPSVGTLRAGRRDRRSRTLSRQQYGQVHHRRCSARRWDMACGIASGPNILGVHVRASAQIGLQTSVAMNGFWIPTRYRLAPICSRHSQRPSCVRTSALS